MDFKKYLPILDWLPSYTREDLKGDLGAGLTVGVMLIPQSMAYAMLAGLPPIYGLYASTVPLFLYAIFGTSRQLAVGPVAMDALLVASSVGLLASAGSDRFITLAITLALMVGIIQFLLGVLKLGFLVNFLSYPVVSGFTSAAAFIIGLNQLKHLLGVDIAGSNRVYAILYDTVVNIQHTHIPTLILGLTGIVLILLVKNINKSIPGPLVAVVVGILTVYFLGLHEQGMKIVREVPKGLPSPSLPDFQISDLKALVPAAFTISLIGFMEAIAVAKSVQAKHRDYKIDANQELIGLGFANMGGALFRSFPVTGGFSRTAVNHQAGAKTGVASILSASLIVLTLLFLTPLFYYLPHAILSSVIMVAVFGLMDFQQAIKLWKTDKKDFLMLLITFLVTLSVGIAEGIALGVVLSLAVVLYQSSYPHVAILGKIPGKNVFRNVERYPEAQVRPDVFIFRFDAALFFANSLFFQTFVEHEVGNRPGLKIVIVNAEAINNLDSTAIRMLQDLIVYLKEQDIDIVFAGVRGPVRDILVKNEMVKRLGRNCFFENTQAAVGFYERGGLQHESECYFQTNVKAENEVKEHKKH